MKIPWTEEEIQPRGFSVTNVIDLTATKLTRFVGHGRSVPDVEFLENPLNVRRNTAESVLSSPRKILFFTDFREQTYMSCRAWAQNAKCGVSEESLELKTRYSREATLFSK